MVMWSRFRVIFMGEKEQIRGLALRENSYSCDNCMLELLPQP